MRLKTLATTAAGLSLALGTVACNNDDLTGINRSPNAPSSTDPALLFPDGVTSAVGRIRGANFDLTFTALWAQFYAKIQYVDEDWYQIRPATIDTHWSQLYAGPLKDFQVAAQSATEAGKPEMAAPAIIMRDWTVGVMTDVWGDIPFTEALQASADNPAAFTPAYDPQEVVYDSLLASLESAAAALQGKSSNGLGNADVIYGGDAEKWRRFANSLRARYGLRLSKVNPDKARQIVESALAAGVMESNADNAVLVWPGDGVNNNPYYDNFLGRDDHRVSKTMVDTLANRNDPRLAVYAMPTQDDPTRYVGIPNGLSNDSAATWGLSRTSRPGAFFSQATSPSYLMTYSEVLFIKAEAAARGWNAGGSAKEFYDAGIAASFEQFGVPDAAAAAAAYVAQASVATASLENIALQKWIALFGQGTEGWSEWRRTGVPNLVAGPEAVTANGQVARRLAYPSAEQSLNGASLAAAQARQGDTSINGRVWWDVQ